MKNPAAIFLVTVAAFFCAGVSWTSLSTKSFDQLPPAWNIDGVFYDNIALNLAEGNGFVVDFENEKWRHAYQRANSESGVESYKWVFQFEGSGPTTMRSPGYPYFLSLVYKVLGWRYEIARYIGILCASIGLATMIAWCFTRWGYLVAGLATLTILVDYSIMQSSGMIASESLAVMTFAFAFVALSALLDRPNFLTAFFAGVAFAVLFLTRGNWNLGLLLVVAMTVLLFIPRIRKLIEPLNARHIAIVLITAIVVGMPWWIRNCQATGHFQPFGTAGSSGLVAAYCDESLADYGNWKAAAFRRNQRSVFKNIDLETTPLAHREYLVGQSSTAKAMEWAIANWVSLPKLAVFRYLSHWGLFNRAVPTPFQILNAIWLIFGLIGCLGLSGEYRKLIAFVLLLDALIVMLTWPHLGRYGIPVRPILHIGCAIFIFRFWRYVLFERKARNP